MASNTDSLLTILTLGLARFAYVNEGTNQVVTRFGKYLKTLEPGLRSFPYMWGLLGNVYRFRITDPVTGVVTTTSEVDMKEIVYDYPRERVLSRDNVQFEVNAVIFFRVADPYKALFKVTDYIGSMRTLVQAILRAEMGRHNLEETYSNRQAISQALTREADLATDDWGIKVIRLEIKELELGEFAEDLLQQKRQDIASKQQIIQAEGMRAAKIKEAEGLKEAAVLKAEGERLAAVAQAEAIKIRAEADAEALKKKYQAEAYGYEVIAGTLRENPEITYYLKLHAADKISRNLSEGTSTKLYLPNGIDQLLGAFSVVSDAIAVGSRGGSAS
jgi:regulator of protease activity HflC (stomatin/prohibitin superfamily)